MSSQKRKNKKKYYQSSKKVKSSGLESGMKGFLITCNDEHRCVKEAYNLLNEFADEVYGPEFKVNEVSSENSADIDVTEILAQEISAIKSKRRFQQVFMKAKGILFINTTVPDPVLLVNKIFETVINSEKKKTRFILKLKPVISTCKANEEDIRKALNTLIQQYVSDEKYKELEYKVASKITFNDTITSSHFVWYVRDSAKNYAPKWTANILKPRIIFSFYVLRSMCCISILENYEKYKKYNLSLLVKPVIESQNCQVVTNSTIKSNIISIDNQDNVVISEKDQQATADQ